jgi:hypothetical protein
MSRTDCALTAVMRAKKEFVISRQDGRMIYQSARWNVEVGSAVVGMRARQLSVVFLQVVRPFVRSGPEASAVSLEHDNQRDVWTEFVAQAVLLINFVKRFFHAFVL